MSPWVSLAKTLGREDKADIKFLILLKMVLNLNGIPINYYILTNSVHFYPSVFTCKKYRYPIR